MNVAPKPADAYTSRVVGFLRNALAKDLRDPRRTLYHLLRVLAKWRAEALREPALWATGGIVASGPFAGMKFEQGAAEGCFIPKLLGCYEAELHEHWVALRRDRTYRTIIDVGAAEGYYAVGLARLFPEARVVARDTNRASHAMLLDLARRNGVAARIAVGGLFAPDDFAAYADQPTLLLCDIEGGELQLLDPAVAPALRRFDIVVEAHEGVDDTIPRQLARRFVATHDIVGVRERLRDFEFPPRYQPRDSIDRMISVWEFRSSPTPWVVMRAKDFPSGDRGR